MKTKLCTKCHKSRGIVLFVKDSTKPDGYYSSCKDCYRTRIGAKKRMVREKIRRNGEVLRWCGRCKQYKQKIQFYPNRAYKDGIHVQCKRCSIKDASTEAALIGQRGRGQRERMEALMAYSGKVPKCACCGEKENKFLSIDHINGGGSKHRKSIGHGHFFRWLKVNNFPKGFQVLCHNCNLAKGFYGKCPHNATL
jgi:hypothetical protein